MKMTKPVSSLGEIPVDAKTAARVLGCGRDEITDLKKAMGLQGVRRFFLSTALKFMRDDPHWKETHAAAIQARSSKHSGRKVSTADKSGEPVMTNDR